MAAPEGTLTYWLSSKDSDWHCSGQPRVFKPLEANGLVLINTVHSRTLRIEVRGLEQGSAVFAADPGQYIDREGQLKVSIEWERSEVRLYFNGDLAQTCHLEDAPVLHDASNTVS